MKPSGIGVQNREVSNDLESVDVTEKGRSPSGEVITSNRRMYMQFLAYGDVKDTSALISALKMAGVDAVLYEDINDPTGVGLLTLNEAPERFIEAYRPLLNSKPFAELTPK